MDSVGIDMQPKNNYQSFLGVYFVLYGIVAHFFVFNIIIAVFVEKYIVMRKKISKFFFNCFYLNDFIRKRSCIE